MIVYGGDYEHTLDVSSSLHEFSFEYRIAGRPELYAKVLQQQDFDACEFSLSNYIMLRDRGVDWVTAIPVFPSRAFRHGTIMVRRESDISAFADLAGRRVGISDYTMTGGVWCRGIVFEQYGMHWSEMEWLSAEVPRFPAPSAARVTVSQIDLEEALATGAIDALILPRSRDALLPAHQRRFRPLLKDWLNAEHDYYRSTQIYPISHVIVIPRDQVSRHPGLPGALFAAYSQSMVRAKRRKLATSFLPWGAAVWDETMEVFSGDPVPYDLGALNRKTVNKLQDYLIEQQLIEQRHGTDDLFEPVDLSRTSSAA